MPKKQKKSQAAKQRWKKFHEFHKVPTCEQTECDFPQSSAEDRVSGKTNADGVKQAGRHVPAHVQQVSYADAVKTGLQHAFNEHQVNHRDQPEVSSAPQVGYADIVKRGHHSDVAGPSHAERVNLENQPSVTHVCASHSQAHPKYGDSRNSQCTCNSLTFLAFLHENENMSTVDLNLVLDKGDVMYKEAKKRFPKSIHLATDELPDKVDAHRSMYHVDMTQPSRYGTFEEPPEEAVDTFLSLEAGLSCLLSDVQYALLIMSGLCIAVFRSTSGKYGFFDPHPRTPSGLPLALWSRNRGTAVMLKFTLLSDMIKRLQDSYEEMEISPSCTYELKPVQFYSMSTINLSDTITDTVCRPTAATAVAPTHSDTTVDEANPFTPRRNTTTDLTENIFCQMSICTPLVKQKEVHMTQFTSHEDQNEPPNIPTEELCSELSFLPSRDGFSCQSNAAIKNVAACDLSDIVLQKLKKVNKQQRHKMKRRLMASEKPRNQRKENQKRKERQKYASNKEYKEKKKSCTSEVYKNNPEVRQKKQQYIKRRYCENAEFRNKQQQYVKRRYCENAKVRQNQKQYIKRRYYENTDFREEKKSYITKRYRENLEFRERQRCRVTQRYANDNTFRVRHRQLMKQLMRDRYQSNLAFKIMHNMRCAMKIKRKYRWVNRQTQESDNSVINEAISVFKSQIKVGPSYPCTVCFKASFPNQVRPCRRSNYVKNPHVVATCLTGKFVHVCDENCRNEQCNVPDERKREWICHTCHNHLKNGSMPALAVANKLDLADIPPELSDLNILERHLVAKCIPFAKIIPLPKGRQRAIRGNVVCVPSEVQETVEALPRLRINSQVMRVKLKRRLSYKGHQLFQTVSWSKLVQALHKLKQIHPQYKDVSIRDDAELCDPTLPDEDEEDDDENMNEDDYDEADLMEIDSCEKNALSEAQNKNEQDIDMLPCDGEQPHEQMRDDSEQADGLTNGGFALESCLQPPDVAEEILCFSEGIYSVAPAERNNPISFFKTPKLEAMAFPVQFPTGQNTLDERRLIKVSPSGYFKSRLFCIDDRFAKDTNYLFFAQFVTEIHLATSSMTIQLRKAKPLTRDGRKITSGMLQDKHEVEKLVRNKDAVRFMQPLRGTPAYWEKTTRDLFAMIRQLGTPTFFCTFSAAEMRWPEVIEAITRQQGEQVNFEGLDWSAKCDILRSNPVTTMRMFDKRVEALFRDLLLSPAEPLGKVIDYFYRVEFQHRGSPHIHCLLWVEGAPVFEEDDEQTVVDFINKYITAQLPDPHKQPELYKKVTEVQKHSKNHTKTCFRSLSSGCRFGFPKPPCNETMITRPSEDDELEVETAKNKLRPLNQLLNEPETASMSLRQLLARCKLTHAEYERYLNKMNTRSTIILKRDPKDSWINGYNPHLLEAWNSNIDISFVLDAFGAANYLMKYISKKEGGLSEYLKTVIENSHKDSVNECDEMRAVMQAYSKKREISAQECVARACGLHMKQCSRAVIFIPTDDNPVKMSRPLSVLDNTTPESSNVWMTSLNDKYKARPETPEYEEMCMADFAATCRIVYGQQTKGKDVLPLLNEMGFVQRRKNDKPAIIRFHRCSQEKHPEQYYGRLLKLYLPHRSDHELKTPSLPTYQAFYGAGCVQLPGTDCLEYVQHIVKRNREKYEKNSEEIESAVEEYEQNRGVTDEWCNLAPESDLVRLPLVEQEREQDNENEQEDVPDYSRQADASTEVRAIREPPAIDPTLLRQMFQNLNKKQACIFYAVRDWCIKRVCALNPEQFFFYINGGAGTGKSHLIKCIYSEASKILSKVPRYADDVDISKPTVLLTAFTGTAAFNISGTTLHSLLKLPRSLKPPIQGLGNQLDEVRSELLNAEIIVIDEVSMVSRHLFAYVDARLKQIKGTRRPFGGMSVIAVGDFYQLPPVRQSKPLCVHDPSEIDLWREHFQMITLTEIMRQKDDVVFAEMLNRIRVKGKLDVLCEADRNLLSQAITEPAHCPTDALHIFATNKEVDAHNSATLGLLHTHIIDIHADDYRKDPRTGRMHYKTDHSKEVKTSYQTH
ncbi:uncharacterized protein LOC109202971 [Oreochromis niloticus]|uniref:ATP-dependent DNA helicase n=1 Tax=Oreochromis niloticus TaxID=8128 RepID=A0A669DD40_ORENI|nr:uncharacterized protein LOC109202971 [Oreochromis niloticus]